MNTTSSLLGMYVNSSLIRCAVSRSSTDSTSVRTSVCFILNEPRKRAIEKLNYEEEERGSEKVEK